MTPTAGPTTRPVRAGCTVALLAALAGCADAPTPPRAARGPEPTAARAALAIPAGPYVPGQAYFGRNGYVEYVAGDAPVILTAPHGGNLTPSEIPDRTASRCGGSATTTTDLNTIALARAMQARYHARFGRYPHVVVMHLARLKLDANRLDPEAACGDPEAQTALAEWHDFIDAARGAVLQASGRGWYMDMHGHGHSIQRLELGYLLTGAQLDLTDAQLDANAAYEDTASVRTMSEASPASFAALLRGPTSLGTLYASNGFPSIPSSSDPRPGGTSYFTGGDNTRRHACGAEATPLGGVTGGDICGVQIEANYTGVRDNATNRDRFGDATAIVLEQYLAAHWGLQLGGPPPPNAAPTASFASSCADLSCAFTDGSTDADGTVSAWSWSFGDGATSTARHPAHAFATAGTYTVSLTVTDDDGATASSSSSVTVTAPSGITLATRGYKVKGSARVDLTWSGAAGASVDVHRNGVKLLTTANDGAHTDVLGKVSGTFAYRVCVAGTGTCSATSVVTF